MNTLTWIWCCAVRSVWRGHMRPQVQRTVYRLCTMAKRTPSQGDHAPAVIDHFKRKAASSNSQTPHHREMKDEEI